MTSTALLFTMSRLEPTLRTLNLYDATPSRPLYRDIVGENSADGLPQARVVQMDFEERVVQRHVEDAVGVLVPMIQEEIVEVPRIIQRERVSAAAC